MNLALATFLSALIGGIILYLIALLIGWLNSSIGWFFTLVIVIAVLWLISYFGAKGAKNTVDKLGADKVVEMFNVQTS
jgi:hypothetical protein